MRSSILGWAGVVAAGLLGCGEAEVPDLSSGGVQAEFALRDDNPTSPSAGRSVSPRDHLEKVSGWYFTHAT